MKRACKRCGRNISLAEHLNVVYCSEKCSRPTVQEFEQRRLDKSGGEGQKS